MRLSLIVDNYSSSCVSFNFGLCINLKLMVFNKASSKLFNKIVGEPHKWKQTEFEY